MDVTGSSTNTEITQTLRLTQFATDRVSDAIFLVDADARFLYVNDASCRLLGYSREELLRMRVHDINPNHPASKWPEAWQELKRRGSMLVESVLRAKDGRLLPVEIASNYFEYNGRECNCVCARDISERKTVSELLLLQSAALQATASGVVITDRNGTILWVNPAVTALTGYAAEELLGRKPSLLKSGKHDDEFYRNLWTTISSGRVWRGEIVNRRKDGSLYTEEMTITPVLDARNNIAHFVAVKQDITARKQTEQALRESEELFRSLSASSPLGIFLADGAGKCIYSNPRCRKIFGLGLMDSIGDGWIQAIDPQDRETVQHQWSACVREGREFSAQFRLQADGQTARWVHVRATRMLSTDGEHKGHVATVEDITARKQADCALQDANRRLRDALAELKAAEQQVIRQERLRALGTMASGIAHDFNNALASILGFSELLLHRPDYLDDRAKTRQYLRLIHTAARDAGNIVNRLREFYRHREQGEHFESVDLNALIEQAILLTQPKWQSQAQAAGSSIRFEKKLGRIPPISGNASDLSEVLTNLIFNAVDAMPNGGTITIRTQRDGSQVLLTVSDTGAGMTEQIRQRCLEPFFSTKGERGTGLGLSMVYGILQRHGGDIEIESEPGKGATFTIRLPVGGKQTPPAPPAGPAEAPAAVAPLRILLADDEPQVRDVISEFLRGDGHTVETAANGRDALEKFQAGGFDLVLADRAMPELNGDELAATVKSLAPAMPVVMLTGFGSMMEAAGERPAGVDCIVNKPVTMMQLRQALASVLAR